MLNNILKVICKALEENMASDIVALDLKKTCTWTDYMVIATAKSRIHMNGMFHSMIDVMATVGLEIVQKPDRNDQSNWKIIDGGSVLISLMGSEERSFYALEELWFEAEIIYSSISS